LYHIYGSSSHKVKENKTISLVDHVICLIVINTLNMPLSIEISWVEQCIYIVFMYEMCLNLNLHTFEGIMEDINDFLSWSIKIFSPKKFYVMIFFLFNQILPFMPSEFYWFEDDFNFKSPFIMNKTWWRSQLMTLLWPLSILTTHFQKWELKE